MDAHGDRLRSPHAPGPVSTGQLRRWLHYHWLRLRRLQGKPDYIARGLAIGVFTGMMPLVGVQTLVAITLATLLRGNPIAAAATTWISNPLTVLPLYALDIRLGQLLLHRLELTPGASPALSAGTLWHWGQEWLLTLTVGSVALGMPLALGVYGMGLWGFRRWKMYSTKL